MGSRWHKKRWHSSMDAITDTDRKKKRRSTSNISFRVEDMDADTDTDWLTNFPPEILSQILSRLPTKDVAVMQVLSKKMEHADPLALITSVDLDDSHICPLENRFLPHVYKHPLFKSFVVNVLQRLLQAEAKHPLNRFRLSFGLDRTLPEHYVPCKVCLPYLEPTRFNAWISFPLAHTGLRDLDLSFHISNPNECELPSQLFNRPSLEFFRLDCNLCIDGANIPLISFPNLKLMHIEVGGITGDEFVNRLVPSCPVLEDLKISCRWKKIDRVTISAHLLRRLKLSWTKYDKKLTNCVIIDTPNLQYLYFLGDVARHYSITHMNALTEAELDIECRPGFPRVEDSSRSHLRILSALSGVQHLYLQYPSLEVIIHGANFGVHLPVFCSLRTMKLAPLNYDYQRWDVILLPIIDSSPLLETLVFPQGLFSHFTSNDSRPIASEEAEVWRVNQLLPSRRLPHLSRLEFGRCIGTDRELNMIKYLLGKALSLKELCLFKDVVVLGRSPYYPETNFDEFVSKLEDLLRDSNSCSIIVHQ